MSKSPKSIAVCVARNAEDIIAFSVLHHLLAGVERCIVVDNGSSDGTGEILKAIARKTGRVSVVYDAGPLFEQAKIVNGVVNAFTEGGEVAVLPFDADELWAGTVVELAQQAERTGNVLSCEVVNFVQSRAVAAPSRSSWLRAYRRALVAPGDARELVLGQRGSFVQIRFPRKVVFRARGRVELNTGAHRVSFDGADAAPCDAIACLHLPLRARAELIKRATEYEPRRAPLRPSASDSWQSRYWAQQVARGHTEREWRANSYDRHGNLDVFGRQVATFRDFSLVRLLARAYAYGRYLNVPMGPESFAQYAEPATS
jgi:glycosyltransferase involved in cell wall biosynthesis